MCLAAASSPAAAQDVFRAEKIEVTGSHIRRIDTETVAPLDVVTREEIDRSGHRTVAEPLRDLPGTAANINESNATGTAPYEPAFAMLYDVSLYDARGRQVRVGIEWKM